MSQNAVQFNGLNITARSHFATVPVKATIITLSATRPASVSLKAQAWSSNLIGKSKFPDAWLQKPDSARAIEDLRWVLTVRTHQIPSESFYVAPHLQILNPDAWLQKLRREVTDAIDAITSETKLPPRAKCGALATEVAYFRTYLEVR